MIVNKRRIYKVVWKIRALEQLEDLKINDAEIERIEDEVYQILSIDPYGKLEPKHRKLKYNIKKLRGNFEGQWRLRIKEFHKDLAITDYRIIYEIVEDEVIVNIFKFEHRATAYEDEDFWDKW
ncbi:MAG: type II toxin-antitoxin system mRNA interferase toxin, RelE/StbE family [Spiroplasmataceae bacterium]|nr:type II toxin-antitoxin system mRNA interferase toxin, RelE/StbE family [Spiroplasmataceae bacterium]